MPYQSSFFGFYAVNSTRTILDMQEQDLYIYDTFGLQTLDKRGGLIVEEVQGITHQMWLTDEALFLDEVLPWLT